MRPESYAHIWDALQAVRALRRFTQGVSEEEYLSDLMLIRCRTADRDPR